MSRALEIACFLALFPVIALGRTERHERGGDAQRSAGAAAGGGVAPARERPTDTMRRVCRCRFPGNAGGNEPELFFEIVVPPAKNPVYREASYLEITTSLPGAGCSSLDGERRPFRRARDASGRRYFSQSPRPVPVVCEEATLEEALREAPRPGIPFSD